ncbi:probable Rho GTPase-activating protein CG5521 isoform X2 [Bactrocera neohumeralis]|uniref:probable Rho GTPase-activating protein CG5521 isoform X2 n=1 Tax=Bactrocera neohumeralis TaxID=98809 RepID=UPI00216670A3|nr:probable Rho GTPase-activating protein CG5521 isoform X2 [Bactrocera neohumeralis]
MFTKKSHADIKKSTGKFQDCKKDSTSRLRHLRTILDNVDQEEAKSLFETNYSHVYFILYDTFIQAEANLKQKVHKAHREELDGSLWLLEKILCWLPELLARRWQCHSLSRIMAKLLHLGNSPKLRREGVRYFLLWYQALGENAPSYVHSMYADLIPGLIVPQKGIVGPDVEFNATDFLNHPNMKVDGGTTSVFHDTFSHPVQNSEIVALLPPSSNEKSAPPDPRDGLEILLNSMLQTVACLRWRDNRSQKDHKAFAFLLQRFKDVFLPVFCPNFDFSMSVYDPRLELPIMRSVNKKEEVMSSCVVVLINWISHFTHERTMNHRLDNMHINEGHRLRAYQQSLIVRDVLYATRENINFVHEVYRQAFLLNFTTKSQIDAIRTAIAVYRDWMTGTTPPHFLLEPDDNGSGNAALPNNSSAGSTPRSQRLRTPSYVGAMSKENVAVRAGLQNVLQIFVTNAANVFLVNTSHLNINFSTKSRDYRSTPLHEQTEVCKKVLNVYRTMVMNTRMEPKTWEQLLLVLLQVTSIVLHQNLSGSKSSSLGGILGQAIFQTLIVTWIRAHTNVPVNVQLWEKFLAVLASLTYRDELIIEWDKTIQTLTRVFSRYVYALNLQDLPLDRLAESKGKRRRIGSVWQQSGGSAIGALKESRDRDSAVDRERESNSSRSDEQSNTGTGGQLHSHQHSLSSGGHGMHAHGGATLRSGHAATTPLLSRSYSEGSLASVARNSRMRSRRHRNMQKNAVPPVLPTNVEHSLSALLSQQSTTELTLSSETLNARRFGGGAYTHAMQQHNDMRRAMSLDSVANFGARPRGRKRRQRSSTHGDDDEDVLDGEDNESGADSRSPSPTASSGIEGSSIKDAQIQMDVLAVDSGSLEEGSSGSFLGSERRSIILGGVATGWLPDSTAIMWKRMLGALGDVNRIPKAELHAQVFKHLLDMTTNLIKIKQNQGISTDNQSTPPPPTLVPPIGIVAPWCYGALELDKSFKKGKLLALQLLCSLAVHGAVSGMQHLPLFYHSLHKLLTGEDRDLIYAILKHVEGPRFLSLLLPGHTLLLLDIVHASAILLTSLEANRNTPRAEVAALLGSLLCYPSTLIPRPVLQPSPQIFELMECPDLQDHILNIVLRCARREPSAKARCIALSQLGQWILLKLSHPLNTSSRSRGYFQQAIPHPPGVQPRDLHHNSQFNPRIREALQVLLQALQFKHRTIAIVAVDALKLCAERGRELASIERLPQLIITAICKALEIQQVANPKDSDKIVLTSLMLCLGEYCMSFPASLMLAPLNERGDTLVLLVLRVLMQIASGAPRHERVKLTADDDFDTHISSDDLQTDGKLPEANYQTSETIQACISAIKMCAKAIAMHLVTHLGHFPMGIGASRLSSMVEEQDDVAANASLGAQSAGADARRDSVELPSVLHAQNLQLFMLSSGLVASFIELPALKLPGGGATAGLITAEKQVRVLLRDLNGKACWDASILYSEPRKCVKSMTNESTTSTHASGGSVAVERMGDSMHRSFNTTPQHRNMSQPMDSLISSMIGLDVLPPRHTLRHRPAGELPLAKDLAPDLDQLDDLLAYIGHTSPECLTNPLAQLNTPGPSPLGSSLEAQTISIILNQRALEQEYVSNLNQQALQNNTNSAASLHHDQHSMHSVEQASHASFESYNTTSLTGRTEIPFQYCRLLFSHLGMAGWERRSRTHLLQRTEKLLRELRNVDQQRCRETHKMAVIYVASGQEDKSSILNNASGSSTYEMFVSALGWEIDLETHNGFLGGLPRQGCGATAPYYATPFLEVIYHVATRMPSDSPENLLLKTRHLGNDEVHIVWSEHYRDYRRDILPTEFCDVLIVVYPLKNGLFRVTVNRKPEVPWFGPLANESIVSGACLATLIRATAINASRAKRAAMSLFQQYYEERNRSLESVSSRYKESTTFEDFANRIYNPMPLRDTGAAAPLAAALIDHHRSSIKGWVQASIDSNTRDLMHTGLAPSASATTTAAMEAATNSSSSPRGARKLGAPFKSVNVPKKNALQSSSNTPPESPTLPLRRFK